MAGIDITAPAPQFGQIIFSAEERGQPDQHFIVQTWQTPLGEEIMVRRVPSDSGTFPINNLLGEAMALNPPRIERPKNGGIEVFEREDDDTSLGAELLDVLDPHVEFGPFEEAVEEISKKNGQPTQRPLPITSLVRPIVLVLSLIFVTATGILLVSKFLSH